MLPILVQTHSSWDLLKSKRAAALPLRVENTVTPSCHSALVGLIKFIFWLIWITFTALVFLVLMAPVVLVVVVLVLVSLPVLLLI
jgi:hypothetical protein